MLSGEGETGPATEMKAYRKSTGRRRVLDDCESLNDGEQGRIRERRGLTRAMRRASMGKRCTWHVT